MSMKNLEYAVACAGYAVNDVPTNLGASDALPHGWSPVIGKPGGAARSLAN